MDVLKKIKIHNKGIQIKKEKGTISITNKTNKKQYIIFPRINHLTRGNLCRIIMKGKMIYGDPIELKLVNLKAKVTDTIQLDTNTIFFVQTRKNIFFLKVFPNSKVELKEITLEKNVDVNNNIKENFNGDTLVITPGYPSQKNKYLFGFVHTRVLEYKKAKWNIDVASVSEEKDYINYEYDGVSVNKIDYFDIRNLLQEKKYKRIIVHFFKDEYAQILNATNTYNTDIYIYFHGSDIAYRDINFLTREYFSKEKEIDSIQNKKFEQRDKIIKKYNDMPNVKFVFPSNWLKERTEKQNNIKYNNYEIIPTFIDEKQFDYIEKSEELRKNILIIRKFDNLSTYGIDLDVRAILELSKKPYFEELTFNIYGDGNYHDVLLEPIKKFKNVKIYKKFLSHDEISSIHKENGIALFATRYETQGVSAAEAAMSGLVVLTNEVAAVPEMFNKFPNLMAPKDDYEELVNQVDYFYNHPKEYLETSKKLHDAILKQYGYKNTMKKELDMFKDPLPKKQYSFKKLPSKKVLTIAIASYNVEKFLFNIVQSLIEAKNAEKLEILIINDGSKDNTGEIAKELEKITTIGNDSIVKFVDKPNGGHGSAINKGIELATGKYFKLMDGDDYFDTDALDELIVNLEKSDEDIILNNYVEDLSSVSRYNVIRHYEFMEPGKTYNIEDLCYKGYGFGEWGPLLSTSTFKTKMLKDANFKISEKCFYVDMELNSIAFVFAKTIKYYPLDLYIYYLGRVGQSISAESFKKNYKNHERVTLRIIKDIYYKYPLSDAKREYLKTRIIIPLIKAQYYVVTEYFKSGQQFMEFDSKLKEYSEFYNDNECLNKRIKIYRKTKGKFVPIIKELVRIKKIIKK